MQLLDDDIEWWVNGDLPASGTYHGREAVTGLFGLLRDNVPAGLEINITAATAEEDRVAIEMNSLGKFTGDREYRNIYHMLFWVRDGSIVKAHEYFDTKYTAQFLED
jgi:ketosteroid isomerase-like protein